MASRGQDRTEDEWKQMMRRRSSSERGRGMRDADHASGYGNLNASFNQGIS